MKYEHKIASPPDVGTGFLWLLLAFGSSINIEYFKKNFSKNNVKAKDIKMVINNKVNSI
tara:strand:+ start:25 stop:201 length:177 start_codon:yes stop_codon:yes gene_type:complete